MRFVLGLVMVAGCVQAGTSPRRWPNHRKVHDQQLEQIDSRTKFLEQRVDELARELASARAALVKLQGAPAPVATPAATSAAGELPKSAGATP